MSINELIEKLNLFEAKLIYKEFPIGLNIFVFEGNKYRTTVKQEYKHIRFEIFDRNTMELEYKCYPLKECEELIFFLKLVSS